MPHSETLKFACEVAAVVDARVCDSEERARPPRVADHGGVRLAESAHALPFYAIVSRREPTLVCHPYYL